MIVREDIWRTREASNGPETGDELQVDTDALTAAAVLVGDNIAGMVGGNPNDIAAAWAQGFMAGVRAAREDEKAMRYFTGES